MTVNSAQISIKRLKSYVLLLPELKFFKHFIEIILKPTEGRPAGATGTSWYLTYHFSNYWGTAPALQAGSLKAALRKPNNVWHDCTVRVIREQTAPYAYESLCRDTLISYTDLSVQRRFKLSKDPGILHFLRSVPSHAQPRWTRTAEVYFGISSVESNRVWLQTALSLSALARSDTSASASDVTCSLFNFYLCIDYFCLNLSTFYNSNRWWRQEKIQCHLQSLLVFSATCDVTCIRHESCVLPTETRYIIR